MEETTMKTGYQWCLEANIRILDLTKWANTVCEDLYFKTKISAKEFYERLEKCDVKPNSQPRKSAMYLEYRMYGMVPYQFRNTAHVGIQHGHAVSKYQRAVVGQPLEPIYNKWIDEDVTIIVLNGGTTNNNPERLGSLNKNMITLRENGVFVQDFYEPDLNDALTGIAFLVDERVFNREVYPDFVPETLPWGKKKPSEKEVSEMEVKNAKNYEHWVEKIGGPSNAFLRTFLRSFQLA